MRKAIESIKVGRMNACALHLSFSLLHSIKKRNILKDKTWKALQFPQDYLIYSCTFCFQNGQNFRRSHLHHWKTIYPGESFQQSDPIELIYLE